MHSILKLALSAVLAAGLIAPVPLVADFGSLGSVVSLDPVPAAYAAKKKSSKISKPKTQRVKSYTTKKGKRVQSYKRSKGR